jgi:hypothetical protein
VDGSSKPTGPGSVLDRKKDRKSVSVLVPDFWTSGCSGTRSRPC